MRVSESECECDCVCGGGTRGTSAPQLRRDPAAAALTARRPLTPADRTAELRLRAFPMGPGELRAVSDALLWPLSLEWGRESLPGTPVPQHCPPTKLHGSAPADLPEEVGEGRPGVPASLAAPGAWCSTPNSCPASAGERSLRHAPGSEQNTRAQVHKSTVISPALTSGPLSRLTAASATAERGALVFLPLRTGSYYVSACRHRGM